jgi:hypothetical protein
VAVQLLASSQVFVLVAVGVSVGVAVHELLLSHNGVWVTVGVGVTVGVAVQLLAC